jgi:hypothetical protein
VLDNYFVMMGLKLNMKWQQYICGRKDANEMEMVSLLCEEGGPTVSGRKQSQGGSIVQKLR